MSTESALRPSVITCEVATEVWRIINGHHFTAMLRAFEEELGAAGIALVHGEQAVALSDELAARAAVAVARVDIREKFPQLLEAEVARRIEQWLEGGYAASWVDWFLRTLGQLGIVPQGVEQHVERSTRVDFSRNVAPSTGELLFQPWEDLCPPELEAPGKSADPTAAAPSRPPLG
jgi:hypothetical protein